MCIVIDANTIACVFDRSNSDHDNFKPVYEWIKYDNGKIVLGGTTYLRELTKMSGYLSIIKEFTKTGDAVIIDQSVVDNEEKEVDRIHASGSSSFNDKHLVAIIRASKCMLLCSNDSSSDKFIKNAKYYRSSKDRPSIYRDNTHRHLLCNKNIAPCCK